LKMTVGVDPSHPVSEGSRAARRHAYK
jgi:hypothetical protein